ncbi:hypothetical protein SALBM311S_08319 [Streptomyces alboniger]
MDRRKFLTASSGYALAALGLPDPDSITRRVNSTSAAAVRVGRGEVAAINIMVKSLGDSASELGGGHARHLAVRYLTEDVAPGLNGTYPEATGKELFAAASQLTHLAGWMAQDEGDTPELQGLAQGYYARSGFQHLDGLSALPGRCPAGARTPDRSLCPGRGYMFAVLGHSGQRIRVLGATATLTASCAAQAARNLVMDLEDAGCRARFMIRDRNGKYPALFDTVLEDAGIEVVLGGIRMPRMNALMERWVQTCRRELLDRTLVWNQRHLLHALREFEQHYNSHRPHRGIAGARPLHAVPPPITDSEQLTHLDIRRRDHLGGTLHEYRHAA